MGSNKAPGRQLRYIATLRGYAGVGCVIWPFKFNCWGYPKEVSVRGRSLVAYRLACQMKNGPPPTPQHEAAHERGNRKCINPNHLTWKTTSDNCLDKWRHGTMPFGENHHEAKLDDDKVREIKRIRRETDLSQRKIAEKFGVSQKTVLNILHDRIWQHVA